MLDSLKTVIFWKMTSKSQNEKLGKLWKIFDRFPVSLKKWNFAKIGSNYKSMCGKISSYLI